MQDFSDRNYHGLNIYLSKDSGDYPTFIFETDGFFLSFTALSYQDRGDGNYEFVAKGSDKSLTVSTGNITILFVRRGKITERYRFVINTGQEPGQTPCQWIQEKLIATISAAMNRPPQSRRITIE